MAIHNNPTLHSEPDKFCPHFKFIWIGKVIFFLQCSDHHPTQKINIPMSIDISIKTHQLGALGRLK